ncbi:SAM-dependent methyltransferase [Streptomyces iconiensis]|uniref:SAM-dependent methyltransferase n=1 Tax=Streptomyces iconiensis TaxID=1384038 RepID=A0ABT7A4S3_9ACTN|nr:SAM-dependent methyltransferase [Streptomyces iconiensis]MDJ1136047.1 SAM-dependent methyltransferase [Streptomyces iconiensis]
MNTPAEYFAGMYRDAEDPWSLGVRWYEQRKYALTTAALPRDRYRAAFEPGCSVGVLSVRLAERCAYLLSCDRSPRAVAAARRRLSGHPHARVHVRVLPEEWPEGAFDLVVLSEILYYFGPTEVGGLLARAAGSLESGGTLVAVHWRHPVADHAQSGDAVHAALRRVPGLVRTVAHEEDDFLLDVFVRVPAGGERVYPRSVAESEGLA